MIRLPKIVFALAVVVAGLQPPLSSPSLAQALIRDAETEHISREWATPLFAAAGLDPAFVEIHLVHDDRINAFVAGGQRVFLNTGLLLAAETPMQVLGVIAHETGHLAGGHIARTQEALRNANAQAVAAFLLGAAAIAGGGGDAGAAVILGGRQAAERSLLNYSRAQESAADLAGVRLMAAAGYSALGIVEFIEILAEQEGLLESRRDPYLQSHPMFPDRIAALRAAAEAQPNADTPTPEGWDDAFARVQGKLYGYLETPARVLRRYPLTDESVPARYARAVSYDQAGRLADSLAEIAALLVAAPDDPYFLELHGQVLLQHGRVADSLAPYQRAVDLAPNEPQIRAGLAAAQIATGDAGLLPAAIANLQAALAVDRRYAEGWRQLAVAHGRNGDIGQSALASAEQHMLAGRASEALRFAQQALRLLPTGTPGWLRAQDIENAVELER